LDHFSKECRRNIDGNWQSYDLIDFRITHKVVIKVAFNQGAQRREVSVGLSSLIFDPKLGSFFKERGRNLLDYRSTTCVHVEQVSRGVWMSSGPQTRDPLHSATIDKFRPSEMRIVRTIMQRRT
jgi:hypothetical protein